MSTSTSKQKKSVGKEDLRRLMKQHQLKTNSYNNSGGANSTNGSCSNSTQPALISSPLAKYNSLGQLSCVVCGCQIKTALLWSAHVLSRSHKENVARLKNESSVKVGPAVSNSSGQSLKRKATDNGEYEGHGKLSKVSSESSRGLAGSAQVNQSTTITDSSTLPTDFFDSAQTSGSKSSYVSLSASSSSHTSRLTASTSSHASRLAQYSDDSEDDEDISQERLTAADSKLPSDFFEPHADPVASTSTTVDPTNSKTAAASAMKEKLPEGFFDDPVMDAKVREVEYRNKMEDEWESFQKSMKAETVISEALVEEDDDQREAERNLDEIDDQMSRWSKVDVLQKRKDSLMCSTTQTHERDNEREQSKKSGEENMELSDDDDDIEVLLDWRSKTI